MTALAQVRSLKPFPHIETPPTFIVYGVSSESGKGAKDYVSVIPRFYREIYIAGDCSQMLLD